MNELPQEPGYYWAKYCEESEWEVIELRDDRCLRRTGESEMYTENRFFCIYERAFPPRIGDGTHPNQLGPWE